MHFRLQSSLTLRGAERGILFGLLLFCESLLLYIYPFKPTLQYPNYRQVIIKNMIIVL